MLAALPSIDRVLRTPVGQTLLVTFGQSAATASVRHAVESLRDALKAGSFVTAEPELVAVAAQNWMMQRLAPSQKRVINLTGTVLHTNLGRALLPEEAVLAVTEAMRHPTALEFTLDKGERGERDDHVRGLICDLTGAEDACLVNNNAAAVLLVLNSHARDKDTIVSRGELIEIGGSFRLPDIMLRAQSRLKEVGTTNRTHLRDYEEAIGPQTGMLLKAHTSNFVVQGFTKAVDAHDLARLAARHGLPFADDLGSGTLVDLSPYGLPRERTVMDALAEGAGLVTFSGDKLLGGPQCGFIVGQKDLVRACARNHLKRTLRLDKLRLAALEATLKLYLMPEKLAERLPTLRLFARSRADMRAQGERLLPLVQQALGAGWQVHVADCMSQVGSGSLPLDAMASSALVISPADSSKRKSLTALARKLRRVPVPVLGRLHEDALWLDLRCLEDEAIFCAQMRALHD